MTTPPAGYLAPGEVLQQLASSCPGLKNADLTTWRRTQGLIDTTDFTTVITGTRRDFYYYNLTSLPKIRRLYHYAKIRQFSAEMYRCCANLEDHKFYYLFFDRNLNLSRTPRVALHELAKEVLIEVERDSSDMFGLHQASTVYGGDTNYIARCSCADDTDLAECVNQISIKLRQRGATTSMRWHQVASYYSEEERWNGGMQAIVVLSLSDQQPPEQITSLFDTIKGMPEVLNASIVFGDADLIITVEAANEQEFSDLVVSKLRTLEGITSSRTYIVAYGYGYMK